MFSERLTIFSQLDFFIRIIISDIIELQIFVYFHSNHILYPRSISIGIINKTLMNTFFITI